jgi:glycosyltransferase involved in cell wall biosynthesis
MPRFPGPGGETRQFCLLRELSARHEYTIVPVAQRDDPYLEQLMRLPVRVDPIFVGGARADGWEAGQRFKHRLATRFPTLAGAYRETVQFISPSPRRNAFACAVAGEARLKLAGLRLNDFDIVQVEHTETGCWLAGLNVTVPRLLVCHNVNTVIARREAEIEPRTTGSIVPRVEHWKVRLYERRILREYRNCIVVSGPDRDVLQAMAPAVRSWIVPNGVDTAYFNPRNPSSEEPGALVYSGNMSWRPNVDAMAHFCTAVLPRIRQRRPGVTLTIVGMNPSGEVQALAEVEGVIVTGSVADVRPFIAEAAMYIVPLRIGGGTRLKILEAMAMGKAVVSTSVGCEGLEVTPGQDIVVADSPEAFAEAVCLLLEDPARRRALGEAARKLVTDRYDWRTIAKQQNEVYAALADPLPAR